MLFEVEVTDGGNSPMALNRVFDLLEEPRIIHKLFTAATPSGEDLWCQVAGWSGNGPCAAWAALAEDSGDGVILLIYGGDEGIRLKPDGDPGEWRLESPGQWGEPCLMLDKDTLFEE